jgi:hypothetical protein
VKIGCDVHGAREDWGKLPIHQLWQGSRGAQLGPYAWPYGGTIGSGTGRGKSDFCRVDRVDSFVTMLHYTALDSCIPASLAEGDSLPANLEKGKVEVRFIGAIPIPSLPCTLRRPLMIHIHLFPDDSPRRQLSAHFQCYTGPSKEGIREIDSLVLSLYKVLVISSWGRDMIDVAALGALDERASGVVLTGRRA